VPHFQAVIFDFDYTLADSSRGIVACTNHALGALALPPAPPEAIRPLIGLTLADMFLALAEVSQARRAPDFVRLFAAHADQVMVELTVIYEGVPTALAALKARGLKLGIVSTKFRYRIETTLRRANLLDAFDIIVGGEDVAAHKPAPDGLLMAIAKLQSTLASTLYVGDSVTDAQTAQRAAVPFAAVLSGVTLRESLASYPAYAILPGVASLPGLLNGVDGQPSGA
jgi:phosphoglycolate phosphatase